MPFVIMWFALPHEAGYWLTIIPFILLVVLDMKSDRLRIVAIALIIVPSFFDLWPVTKNPDGYSIRPRLKEGAVISDYLTRRYIASAREDIPQLDLPEGSILITGRGAPFFELNPAIEAIGELCGPDLYRSKTTGVRFVDGLPGSCVDSLVKASNRLFILRGAIPAIRLTCGWLPEEKGIEIIESPGFR